MAAGKLHAARASRTGEQDNQFRPPHTLSLPNHRRRRIEATIEWLIYLLDAADGDADLENDDREDDMSDLEDDDPCGDACDYGVPSYG